MQTSETKMIREDIKHIAEAIAVLRQTKATDTIEYRELVRQFTNAQFVLANAEREVQ